MPVISALLTACQTSPQQTAHPTREAAISLPSTAFPAELEIRKPHKIALVLGGGAAKGFAHVGVIRALEGQEIVPDIIVGTSVGAVVGSLYAAGYNGFELEKLSMQIEESQLTDWSLPNRGVLKGEALQDFINSSVKQRPLEKLDRQFAAVATDLQSGEIVVFRSGNTGMAVRASSSVPGVFQPVTINGHDYVDGGLVSPVPVRVARALGADFVIAVDISKKPQTEKTETTIEVMLQTFVIMGQVIRKYELPSADVVITPDTQEIGETNF